MRVALIVLLGGVSLIAGCQKLEPQVPGAEKREAATELAAARRLKRACGSQDTYDRLKAVAFDEAVRVRRAESPVLERLAAASVVRMENPVAKSRDEALNVTVCTGHLVLELPPGAQDAFDGDRRLEADVEYSAQAAADGSGLVYQIKGAEPIIYRLAALELNRRPTPPGPLATPTATAEATPASPPPVSTPVETARVSPPPPPLRPAPRAAPMAEPTRVGPRPTPVPTRVTARPTPSSRPTPTRVATRPAPAVERVSRPATTRAATRPSFNCGYARSRVERLVCADDRLARADRVMSGEFYAALADADGQTRAELRASRDRFLRFRDRCGSPGCVAQAYRDRIDEIRDISGERY